MRLDGIHNGIDARKAQAMWWITDEECILLGAKLLAKVRLASQAESLGDTPVDIGENACTNGANAVHSFERILGTSTERRSRHAGLGECAHSGCDEYFGRPVGRAGEHERPLDLESVLRSKFMQDNSADCLQRITTYQTTSS